ncbi:MAG: GNAT family N-acetyltransferase [Methanomassiliicoccales archaeon]|jgi:ribosomal protein S18 acetylase RimI-like enzyme
MSDILIRLAKEDDWGLIEEGLIEGELLTERPERRSEISRDTLREDARKSIERYHKNAKKPEAVFIAETSGVRAGFVWVTTEINFSDDDLCGWVLEIYVLPEFRRRGIAAKLLERAEEWTKEQNARSLWLNAGGNNDPAIALYKRSGFEIETVHMSKRF